MTVKEKMTAPIASVGADVEQPLSNKLTNQSIADLPGKGNLQATNNAENTAKSANKKNPDDLETVSMMELYDTAYPPKLPIIDRLLYNGTYLFVGSPKIGKSFFMAQQSWLAPEMPKKERICVKNWSLWSGKRNPYADGGVFSPVSSITFLPFRYLRARRMRLAWYTAE